ncbi:class I SAM-dependent methyltransferase [Chelativorans salis]|uniref:Class I SAM-dependent methyltransferase n=1 Tax=Chelativorans salis TaxID=2978478 RepID=A0ABT2LI13_9HYPH|nr:class I SAM-dependent methyltransferase [Chelativorans sp. EGI FJ00035]MCT7374108.1 class I SAM-dependent methyltransferase [Chelativorans sp. EGI FJ00035]
MSDIAKREDKWSAGDAYEPYVGRWSRLVAAEFVDWLDAAKGARWLEVGCGTGALTETILDRAAPQRVVGVDPSEAFLDFARSRLDDRRIELRSGDARALPVENGAFDIAVAGLVLNFVPEPAKAVFEMKRALRPGGIVAVYVWDYAGEMQLMRRFWEAAAALDDAARELDEGRRFPICKPEALRALFAEAGVDDIDGRAIDVPTVFSDFDDYWSPFLGGQGPAPGYCVSLSESKREALREKLRAELPTSPDGSIHLKARAFAIRGVQPA